MTLNISSAFDGGNIIVKDASDPANVRLEIAKDQQSDFYQWFHFRVTGQKGQALRLVIENAGGAAYPKGWENYRAVVSDDLMEWRRVPTRFDGQSLIIETELVVNALYVAYFAPYSSERHSMLVAGALSHARAEVSVLGQTLDGRDLDLITLGEPGPDKRVIWVTARQHPGETMAEWWMEGFLEGFAGARGVLCRPEHEPGWQRAWPFADQCGGGQSQSRMAGAEPGEKPRSLSGLAEDD
jgi:murein tripeptide amidase MpaA